MSDPVLTDESPYLIGKRFRQTVVTQMTYAWRCDRCGRFTRHLHDVTTNPPEGGIAREECCGCFHPEEDHRHD